MPRAHCSGWQDPERGVYIEGLSEHQVNGADGVLSLVHESATNRATCSTSMNRTSSRSHAMLLIRVERWAAPAGESPLSANGAASSNHARTPQAVRGGLLSIVDLAGSERVCKSGVDGMRLEEAKRINKSISALGNCIAALANACSGSGRPGTHVPYRDSKLTRLLTDSLGGNTKTTLCASIGPALHNYDETFCTLLLATRAMSVKTRARINERVEKRNGPERRALLSKVRELQSEVLRLKQRENDSARPSQPVRSHSKPHGQSMPATEDAARLKSQSNGAHAAADAWPDVLDRVPTPAPPHAHVPSTVAAAASTCTAALQSAARMHVAKCSDGSAPLLPSLAWMPESMSAPAGPDVVGGRPPPSAGVAEWERVVWQLESTKNGWETRSAAPPSQTSVAPRAAESATPITTPGATPRSAAPASTTEMGGDAATQMLQAPHSVSAALQARLHRLPMAQAPAVSRPAVAASLQPASFGGLPAPAPINLGMSAPQGLPTSEEPAPDGREGEEGDVVLDQFISGLLATPCIRKRLDRLYGQAPTRSLSAGSRLDSLASSCMDSPTTWNASLPPQSPQYYP